MNRPIQPEPWRAAIQRRVFLKNSAYGLGAMALAGLMDPRFFGGSARAGEDSAQPDERWRGVVQPTHFPVKARRVIHLCMAGGPSQFESLDNKPMLARLNGQPFPESFTKGQQLAQLQNHKLIARGPFCGFRKHGESGQEISDLFPHTARIADKICIIRSVTTEQINHDSAHAFMNSGSILKGRPSMGSWLLYGLGAETENLPGFVVLTSAGPYGQQPVSARQWSAGCLPSKFQGIQLQSRGDAVHYIGTPPGVGVDGQRRSIDEINRLNGMLLDDRIDPEIQTRIAQYEMASRMQASVPELSDFASEPRSILDMYGIDTPGDGSFASNCLMARRLAERGVRMIQLYHRAWDHHGNIEKAMPHAANEVDQACAALVEDLDQRGMLDDTLVIWGGEFGRTPMGQGTGRDHHILGFSIWMAGGGVKPGITHGATDELGYRAVEDVVPVHNLHATILALCGIDDARFSVKFQGQDVRLTGFEPAGAVREIMA